MPKQTFFNLPEQKRERILEAAISEFADKGYKLSSMVRIVNAAGISKGSFYQYFEDKEDLYCHIVTVFIAERKLRAYDEEKERLKDLNLTEFLRLVFRKQMEEFTQNPELLRIGLDLMQQMNDPVFQRIIGPYQEAYQTYFVPYIQHEVDQGELDPQVNQRLLNFMLTSLGQYLIAALGSGQELSVDFMDAMVDDLDYILTNGIYLKARG